MTHWWDFNKRAIKDQFTSLVWLGEYLMILQHQITPPAYSNNKTRGVNPFSKQIRMVGGRRRYCVTTPRRLIQFLVLPTKWQEYDWCSAACSLSEVVELLTAINNNVQSNANRKAEVATVVRVQKAANQKPKATSPHWICFLHDLSWLLLALGQCWGEEDISWHLNRMQMMGRTPLDRKPMTRLNTQGLFKLTCILDNNLVMAPLFRFHYDNNHK